MDPSFGYAFPAIRGIQAKREYFVSMVPLRLVPRMFAFNEEDDVPPELRAQRHLNKGRLPEMTRYMLDNRGSYVFSALTASIDGAVQFEPVASGNSEAKRIGVLRVDMTARFIINDGQHRRAAIEQTAIKEHPDLSDESIAIVFFVDQGLSRCQQMFADLNRYAVRPSSSIGVLYDHRDDRAEIVRRVVMGAPVFKGLIETERSTLAKRSKRLFTLSAVYNATTQLLRGIEVPMEKKCEIATHFWGEVGKCLPEWAEVQSGKLLASEVRLELLHSHGVILQAIGRVGHAIMAQEPKSWVSRLAKLRTIDWHKANVQWEGRTIIGGRVSKSDANVQLTVNILKNKLGVALTPEEQRAESAYNAGRSAPISKEEKGAKRGR